MPIFFGPLTTPPSVEITGVTNGAIGITGDALGASILATSGLTDGRVYIRCDAEGEVYEIDVPPALPSETEGTVYIFLEAENFSNLGGDTDGAVFIRGEAASGYGTEGYATIYGDAGDTYDTPDYVFMIEPFGFIVAYAGVFFESMQDYVALSTDYSVAETAVLRAKAGFNAAPTSLLAATQRANERVKFGSGVTIIFRELLEISVALGTTVGVDYRAIAAMADKLLLSGAVSTRLEARSVLRSALLVGSGIYFSWREVLEDSVSLSAEDQNRVTAIEKLLDRALFEVLDQSTATLRVIIPDTVEFNVGQTSFAELASRLQDQIALSLNVFVDNGEYSAWTVNTATSAHTRYTNYPFNSFMQIGGKYYGTSEQGLYRLEGDNDAGVDITARIRLGLSKLGSGNMKRIQSMYLGYRATGDVLVKVTLADDQSGLRETHVYKLIERGGSSTREARVPIGRGLQSVYWDFEIENANGEDFTIDMLEILPLVSERRVRGSGGGK